VSALQGDVIEAVVDSVQLDVPHGVVVRDPVVSGRAEIKVIDGELTYHEVVIVGPMTLDSFGINATRLQRAYVLGSPGEQPLISGLSTFSQDSFEYWVNTLTL
jgi:hypothetical protein